MLNGFNQFPQQIREGQISKSNFTSSDNPLKYSTQSHYQNYNINNNGFDNNFQKLRPESMNRQYPASNSPINKNFNYNEIESSKNYQNEHSNFSNNQNNNRYNSPINNQFYNQTNPNLYQTYSLTPLKKDSEIRVDMENLSKQAYKRALDQQVVEKQLNKYNEEKERKQNELAIIPQYPFGRRTNPSYLLENNYIPSFGYNSRPNYENMDPLLNNEIIPKLDKDKIVEKPNSLNDDVPPYDPVKESKPSISGNHYDPWGKPGGGAPLIDPDTGKKYTKITGQLKYDNIGLTPSARLRYKEAATKQQILNIEEQKQEMELEQQRRRHEEAMHRAKAGDVATWIQDIEGARWPLRTHLNHTNVTREKVNLEYARRGINDKTRVYHDELGLQLEERERQNKLLKLREDVAGIEHTRHWNDWWGRPGGGAPTIDKRRHEINESLESPRLQWGSQDPNLNFESPSNLNGTSLVMNNSRAVSNQLQPGNVLFTKGTIRSNHKNHYENIQQMK